STFNFGNFSDSILDGNDRRNMRNHPPRDPLRDHAALLTEEGSVPNCDTNTRPVWKKFSNTFTHLQDAILGKPNVSARTHAICTACPRAHGARRIFTPLLCNVLKHQ